MPFATADEATRVVLGTAGDAASLWVFAAADGTRTTYGTWLEAQRTDQSAGSPSAPPRFELSSVGVMATAEVRGGQFVVLKGSLARKDVVDSFERHVPPGYRRIRAELIATGQLQEVTGGGFYTFEDDVVFTGSTPAATVILGRNADGTREWKRRLPDGAVQTHGDYLALEAGSREDAPYTFAWLPFFRALASHLLSADPSVSLDAFKRAATTLGEPKMTEMVSRLCGMDPLTGISLATWVLRPDVRLRWIGLLAQELALDAPLPQDDGDFRGLLFRGYLETIILYTESQSERAWAYDLARATLDGTLDEAGLARAMDRKHFKLTKLSLVLSTLDPERYAPSALINDVRVGERPLKTAPEYWAALPLYQGQTRWPTERLQRQLARRRNSGLRPAVDAAADEDRLQAVSDWLRTQQDNLSQNERDYKVRGAQVVLEKVQAALDTDPPGRIDVQPNAQLNLLGWRTVGALNTLINGNPSAFREALQALWAGPGDAVQADAFWATLDPAVQTLADAEKRGLTGLGTRASVASYFLFLRDPTGHPFYRPTFGGAAIEWLSGGQRRLDRASPGALLADYVDRCETLLPVFQEAGVPLQDMLDVQGALYVISGQYPGGPRSAAGEASDPVVAEFQQFLADPVQQLRCAVRQVRAAQLREVLTAEPPVTLETFNRDVWKFESATFVDGQDITHQLFSDELTPDRARQLDEALKDGRMELHGNYVWGSGAAIFGAALKMDDGSKQALIAQAVELIKGATDPMALAQQLDGLAGFGPNISTGLASVLYPSEFALYNSPSMAAMTALKYDVSTLDAFQASVSELKERVGAQDFLELDWFLYCRVSPQTTWWVNQGNTYAEERAGGYVWASNETGRTLTHHTNVKLLKPGDRIIHYANQAIRAVSVVTAPATDAGDEVQSAAVPAKRGGFMARTTYQDLPSPRPLKSLPAHLRQAKMGPFDKNGNVLQGYLFPADAAVYDEVTQPGSGPSVWLFQSNPKYYDLAGHLSTTKVGDEDEWTVTRHEKEMRIGDPVVLWVSGAEGGVYALGELTGKPSVRLTAPEWRVEAGLDTPAGSLAVPFRYTRILTAPVGRAAIDAHPVLSQMLVRRVPNGTNYKLSQAEWEALQPLLSGDDVWKAAIAEVLAASDEGLHVGVITQRVTETGQVTAGSTPERTVSHVLSAFPDVFEALGSGVYRLKRPDPAPYTPVPFSVIRDQIEKTGPRLDERTLRRYHLALQTRGFVILSGVSGTGKTWLAQSYARAAGAQVQVFPVAPNWMSNEDLLGFYSPLEGGHYHHTPFSRFLLEAGAEYQAAQQAGREARPYHLVLDEMNLARVEYYFAQFLSKMELRARDGDAEIDLGPGQKALLSPNVFVIGTVNVDETTHDFADKVYDRAQVIELPVTRSQLELHLDGHAQADVILQIWDAVHPHAPFAFRVIDELLAYQRAAGELGVDPLEALDDALLQKVLPKVRGTGTGLPQALTAFLVIAEQDFPLSHAKAQRMLTAGIQHGFISFH
ncbi:hypothetical protein QR90_08775 [Deinococcus radiopugnans]|uniref:AAA+ ATPase domain-containing protein n=1 Tax=Deinococcus radiopugnans TaxID=57497 RepID=A0A0A7KG77_9DEIO|nr:hypothetical protein QR90_08775 [Deinococcus radiopugnans]